MFVLDTLNPRGHFRPRKVRGRRYFADEGGDGGDGGGSGGDGDAGKQTPDFESIAIPSDKYADNPNVSKYKTVGELVKGHSEVVKLVGSKGVIVPGENATPAEWDKFYNQMGRPEKPEGYKFSAIKDLHPDVKITPETEAGFKALMHKRGVPAKIADGIFQDYFGMVSQEMKKRDDVTSQAKNEAETKLRNEWGNDFDKNLTGVKRLVEKFGGKEGLSAFDENGLGNNPAVLKTLAGIVKMMSEDSFVKGGIDLTIDSSTAAKKASELTVQIAKMKGDEPEYNQLVEEKNRLYKIAFD